MHTALIRPPAAAGRDVTVSPLMCNTPLRPTNRKVQTRRRGDFNGPVPMVRPRILITGGVWLVAHLGDTPTARGFLKKGAPIACCLGIPNGLGWPKLESPKRRQCCAGGSPLLVGPRCSSAWRHGHGSDEPTGVHFRSGTMPAGAASARSTRGASARCSPRAPLWAWNALHARIMPRGKEVTSGRAPGDCAQAGCTRQREQPNGWIRPATDGCPTPRLLTLPLHETLSPPPQPHPSDPHWQLKRCAGGEQVAPRQPASGP